MINAAWFFLCVPLAPLYAVVLTPPMFLSTEFPTQDLCLRIHCTKSQKNMIHHHFQEPETKAR